MSAQGTYAPEPAAQYEDANGDPAVNYRLFTYLAGSSTKVNTYTDVGLSSANANPLTLASDARPTVMLTPGVSYKFVLALPGIDDPPASVLWTRDNISAVPAGSTSADTDVTAVAGENLAASDAVYLSDGTGGTTAGRWYRADADAVASSSAATAVGFATAAITVGATGTVRREGRVTGLSGLVAGTLYYVSATAGALTATAPTNARAILQADTTTTGIVLTGEPAASASLGGIWTTGAQVLPGDKSPTGAWTFSGRVKVTPWKPLADDFTDHATSGTGATDVWTVSIPANTLANGETLHVEAYGDLTGDVNVKTFTFTLGTTSISTAPNGNFVSYKMKLTLARVSASVQRVTMDLYEGLVGTVTTYAAWTENLGNTLTLKITLTHATAGTTTQRIVRSWIEPAA